MVYMLAATWFVMLRVHYWNQGTLPYGVHVSSYMDDS